MADNLSGQCIVDSGQKFKKFQGYKEYKGFLFTQLSPSTVH